MSSSTPSSTISSSCLPEKLETCLSDEVCNRNPLPSSRTSIDCADDVGHDFYGHLDPTESDNASDDNESAASRTGVRARGLSIDRFFASDVRAFSEGGSSRSAMTDEDESGDEDDGDNEVCDDDNQIGSNDTRSLFHRILSSGSAASRYRVALVPSLGAVAEDESELGLGDDNDSEGVDCSLTDPSSPGSDFFGWETSSSAAFSIADLEDFDSIQLSVASFPTLEEGEQPRADDDPGFGWVWIEVEDGKADETQPVPLARSCEAQEWRWHRAVRKFFAL